MDIVELEGEQGRFAAVVARDRDSQEIRRYPAAAAFVFIGLKPNAGFLSEGVHRDSGGFLVTSATMETSMPGVFAAGDVRSGSTKQLGSAVGDGIAALLMTRRYLEAHHHKAVPRSTPDGDRGLLRAVASIACCSPPRVPCCS